MYKIFLFIFLFIFVNINSQYIITKLPNNINSNFYNELNPSFYFNDLIIMSDRPYDIYNIFNYYTLRNNRISDLFVIKYENNNYKLINLNTLNTKYNDYHLTINNKNVYITKSSTETLLDQKFKEIYHTLIFKDFDIKIYGNIYSININSNNNNKLKLIELNQNSNNIHPSFSSDGKIMFFSSDRIDKSYGGYDIWYSKLIKNKWTTPFNIGSTINSEYDELHPFLYNDTILYFTSNNLQSIGGFDIFYSIYSDGYWSIPKNYPQINTIYNEINFILDNYGVIGYFSSNKDGTYDIYKMELDFSKFKVHEILNEFCYDLYDEINDTSKYTYEWITGDGNIIYGNNVKYCYKKEGLYKIYLNKTNKISFQKNTIEYILKAENNQPYISYSTINNKTNLMCLNGNLNIFPIYYWWYLDNKFIKSGKRIQHKFKKGEHEIKLLILDFYKEYYCYSFKIKID